MRTLLELTKVRLTAMVTLSAATGYVLHARRLETGMLLPALGLFLLAAGSAALNQVQEAAIDARMERTRRRPVPSGRIGRAGAFYVAGLLIGTGAFVLSSLERNALPALGLGLASVAWYNGVYTYLKRVTAFAAVPGALVGALPPVVGFLAAGGDLRDPMIQLVAAFFFLWQIPHFWLLLILWGDQVEAAGLPALGRVFGGAALRRVTFMWMLAAAAAGVVLAATARGRITVPAAALLVAASAWLAVSATPILRPPAPEANPAPFRRSFIRINLYALLVMAVLVVDAIVR
jgi:protoheme IX farnesyltransferase